MLSGIWLVDPRVAWTDEVRADHNAPCGVLFASLRYSFAAAPEKPSWRAACAAFIPSVGTVTIGTPPLLAGLSVLVIEDDQDTLDMFEAYLHYCGALVTAMRSAEQALAYLSRQRVDAITTDVSGDPRRGAAFVSQVRRHPGCDGMPVIAVTAWAAKDFDPIAAGFTAFMHKPIDLDDLAGTLRRLARPT